MKEILSKTIRIMGIYICAMVLVSVIFLLAETKPPKINEAQFFGEGEGAHAIVVAFINDTSPIH